MRRETKPHVLFAALFVLGSLFAIALTAIGFNIDRSALVPYNLIFAPSVTGLRVHAPVRYRGLNVGAVRSIHFDPKHRGQIVIRIMLDRSVPITVSTFGSLQLQGVTGVAFVQLEDTEHSPGRLVSSVDHVAQIPMRPGFFDQLKERVDVSLQAKRNLVVDECVVAEILYANGRRHFTAHKFDHCRGRRCRARSGARD
jgi:phospholipid/cholesterol/gamma-HCH transport system substrate-binding protein